MHRHGVNVLFGAQTLAAIDPHAPSGGARQGVADPEIPDAGSFGGRLCGLSGDRWRRGREDDT